MADPKKKPLRILKPGRLARQAKGHPTTSTQLRKLFNDGQIVQKAKTGTLSVRVTKDAHPSPPRADEPLCTRSQILAYHDHDGNKIAEAHQYLRPDGTIGASGQPDPKEILHDGVLYYLDDPH
jgi:hypothetical protein